MHIPIGGDNLHKRTDYLFAQKKMANTPTRERRNAFAQLAFFRFRFSFVRMCVRLSLLVCMEIVVLNGFGFCMVDVFVCDVLYFSRDGWLLE